MLAHVGEKVTVTSPTAVTFAFGFLAVLAIDTSSVGIIRRCSGVRGVIGRSFRVAPLGRRISGGTWCRSRGTGSSSFDSRERADTHPLAMQDVGLELALTPAIALVLAFRLCAPFTGDAAPPRVVVGITSVIGVARAVDGLGSRSGCLGICRLGWSSPLDLLDRAIAGPGTLNPRRVLAFVALAVAMVLALSFGVVDTGDAASIGVVIDAALYINAGCSGGKVLGKCEGEGRRGG